MFTQKHDVRGVRLNFNAWKKENHVGKNVQLSLLLQWNEWYFRPQRCTVRQYWAREQPGLVRWIARHLFYQFTYNSIYLHDHQFHFKDLISITSSITDVHKLLQLWWVDLLKEKDRNKFDEWCFIQWFGSARLYWTIGNPGQMRWILRMKHHPDAGSIIQFVDLQSNASLYPWLENITIELQEMCLNYLTKGNFF